MVAESMLFSHLLSLPYFLFFADDIASRFGRWLAQPDLELVVFGSAHAVSIWWPLLLNLVTQ